MPKTACGAVVSPIRTCKAVKLLQVDGADRERIPDHLPTYPRYIAIISRAQIYTNSAIYTHIRNHELQDASFVNAFFISAAILSTASLVTARPMPCNDATRDLVLKGTLDPSACCSYGVCIGDVNVQGG
ncbi:hypothetical protein DID88_008912 [Monilinia fructigena]|uniref:Uncharacterized protein n=1 Tax=Monilinia fructigena TaxID=38457 RepID=A0A395J7T8_9HELO|nr:hypothetical protein DID88_008912 [Monilinia fructigena]